MERNSQAYKLALIKLALTDRVDNPNFEENRKYALKLLGELQEQADSVDHFITISNDENGDTGIILTNEPGTKRVKELETDEASTIYSTFKIKKGVLYIISDSMDQIIDVDAEELSYIKPVEKVMCNCGEE